MATDCLGCGARQLVAFASSFGGLNGGRTFVHILLNLIVMLLQVIQDIVLNRPLKETQLAYRGIHVEELNALLTAKGVKHLFAIRLQMGLVRQVHNDVSTSLGHIRNVVLLCIVRHQPINQPQTELGLS